MALYLYQHPETKEIREVFQNMNDEHVYFGEKEEAQIKWNRIFTAPQAQADTKMSEWDSKDFVDKTRTKKETIGDIWDRSKELSQKRADRNGGIDPVQTKFFDDYKKKRHGKRHPLDKRRASNRKKK